MRHLLLYVMLSVIATPIVALQDEIMGGNGSETSVQEKILSSFHKLSADSERFLSRVESRIAVGVRELLK